MAQHVQACYEQTEKKDIFLKIITIITLSVVYYNKTKFSSFNFARVLAFLSGYILAATDEFSIGWKFMRLGIPLIQNHLNRTNI